MLKVVSWNINSIRQRTEHVVRLIHDESPDVICLQEIKCVNDAFPYSAFQALGYRCFVHGMRSYNGVAILLRETKFSEENIIQVGVNLDDHHEARYLEVKVNCPATQLPIHIGTLYAPNGNPTGSQKYRNKISFYNSFRAHIRSRLLQGLPLLIAGDYNIIPECDDAEYPENWIQNALFTDQVRGIFRSLCHQGLTDCLALFRSYGKLYTFLDYRDGYRHDPNYIRIDHILASSRVVDQIKRVKVLYSYRLFEKASDHIPICALFSL